MPQAAKTSSAKPATADIPASAPVRRSSKLLLIVLLIAVLVLLLAVLGVGVLLVMKKGASASSSAEAVPLPPMSSPPFTSAINLNRPPVFVQLEPFVVNLRAGENDDSHYLQTNIALRVSDQKTADSLKAWMPEIRNRINLILTSKSFSDIQSDLSHEKVQSEILRGLNTLFGVPPPPPEVPQTQAPLGPVQGVLFISFIIQ